MNEKWWKDVMQIILGGAHNFHILVFQHHAILTVQPLQ